MKAVKFVIFSFLVSCLSGQDSVVPVEPKIPNPAAVLFGEDNNVDAIYKVMKTSNISNFNLADPDTGIESIASIEEYKDITQGKPTAPKLTILRKLYLKPVSKTEKEKEDKMISQVIEGLERREDDKLMREETDKVEIKQEEKKEERSARKEMDWLEIGEVRKLKLDEDDQFDLGKQLQEIQKKKHKLQNEEDLGYDLIDIRQSKRNNNIIMV